MAEQDSDRSEEATPYKLEEARKKGSVAKSMDFNILFVLAALVVMLYAHGWDSLRQILMLQMATLQHAGETGWGVDGISHWLGQILLASLGILAPLFGAIAIAAILGNLSQVGPLFTTHPLSPDFSRLNPATGLKRLFSMRVLFEAFKSTLKLVALTLIAWFVISASLPALPAISGQDPKGYAHMLLDMTAAMMFKLLLAVLVLALLDFSYTRWEFSKRMRMSKRDVRDEHKHREGDPRIRSRIRELRKEMLKRSKATRKLPEADVLIVNPTHLAVALSYKEGSSGAPQVIAKGAGELAAKMRKVCARHRIPVVQNRSLARTLFREVDYDAYVPEKLYPQVARIMVWVYTMRKMQSGTGQMTARGDR